MVDELINNYQKTISDYLQAFQNDSDDFKMQMVKRLANKLEDELYTLKGVRVVDQDKYLREKISNNIDKIIDEYMEVIHANKVNQDNQLESLYNGMPIENMDDIEIEKVEIPIHEITRRIVDSVITHINYENQRNSMYYQKVRDVERIVKEQISSKSIYEISNGIKEIYDKTLMEMQKSKNTFSEEYYGLNKQKEEPQINEPIGRLRTEVRDGKLYTYDGDFIIKVEDLGELSPEGIFDEPYESENAKKFR